MDRLPRIVGIYRALLHAYPASFRRRFGDEMVQVFADVVAHSPQQRRSGLLARAVADVARSAVGEHWAAMQGVAEQEAVTPVLAAAAAPVAPAGPSRAPSRHPLPTRRVFLRHALIAGAAATAVSAAGASLGYLWPSGRRLVVGSVDLGSLDSLSEAVTAAGGTFAVPSARVYLVAYDPADDPDGVYADIAGGAPFLALFQRCAHLGCRVPWCTSSTRFECPCHKSRYNRWGEYQEGPAPRGLDRFPLTVANDNVSVDVGRLVTGPAQTANVLSEPPSGPSCLG